MTHAHSRLSSDVCLFSICRATYVCLRFVERRLWWDVIKLDETSHQTYSERLIKLDESDSSNLWMKTSFHHIWRKRFIKLDERKRHLIKSNEHVISSNFLKKETVSLLSDEQSCSDIWCKELSLAENHLLCNDKCLCEDCCDKWAFLMKAQRWYNSVFSYKRKASSYVKTMSDCRRSDSSSS